MHIMIYVKDKLMKKLLFASVLVLNGCSLSANDEYDSSDNFEIESTSTLLTDITTYETTKTSIIEQESTETTTHTEATKELLSKVIPEDGQLVRILDYIPDAEVDLRYATTNNFTGTIIYDDPEAYLCYGTVKKLISVQKELKEMGYRILIWDAYRSTEAQSRLWETFPNPTFVANPNNGITSHSQGNTIDISLVYDDGNPVEMPSAFDEFSAIADRDYSDVSETAASNSRLLEDVMYKNGFKGYSGEWWDYSDTDRYELIPILHDELDIGDLYLTEKLSLSNLSYYVSTYTHTSE